MAYYYNDKIIGTLYIILILIKNDISETGICLCSQVKHTLLGSVDS